MEYLVRKKIKMQVVNLLDEPQADEVGYLYVADTHTFNLRGKQIVSLTDLRNYAQGFDLEEASEFIKAHKDFTIDEATEPEEDYDTEDEDNE